METRSDSQQGMTGELVADASGLGTTAANRLHGEVDARKGEAATQVKSLSSAIDKTAEGLGSDAPAWLVSAFRQGSQQVQQFAETLEQKDSRQLLDDVTAFARTSPGTFLGACAAAGFAAARILKAGSSGNAPSQLPAIGVGAPGAFRPSSPPDISRPGGAPRGEFA